MSNKEIIGVWVRTKNVFDNGEERRTVIGEFKLANGTRITTRGYANECEIIEGVTYRLFGMMRNHHKWGDQFAFNSFVEEKPIDEESVIAYLEKMCRSPERGSITHRVALALFELYGVAAVDKLIEDPITASRSIKQWDAAKAATAANYLKSQLGTQRCKLDLISLLNGRKFPTRTMDRAIKEWGVKAAQLIRSDPYILMQLTGIGFLGADNLYCDLSRDTSKTPEEHIANLAKIHRQGMCAAYAVQVQSRQSGSTWVPVGIAKAAVKNTIGGTQAKPDEAIEWAVLDGRLVVRDEFIASARIALHELEIAEFICNSRDGAEWPSVMELEQCSEENLPLSLHQINAIEVATKNRIGCLQGSPGVGKTFSLAVIVKALIKKFGASQIGVAAPTGKAAVRMTQSMANNGVLMNAMTIHRLLQVTGAGGGEGWKFAFNEQNPLPMRFLILDEMSMADVDLMASLVRACTKWTHILFIGDINQLAPVGHGKPFYDLQQCVPTGHLTEIRRNSGRIVQACAEIRDSGRVTFSLSLDLPLENLPLVEVADEDQVQMLQNILIQLDQQGEDVIENCQIITGKNDGSLVARKPLNEMLQKMLNPNGATFKGNPFRIRDKVVCLKNRIYPDAVDRMENHIVANGELGYVTEIQYGIMNVRLSEPVREIKVIHSPASENEKGIVDSEDAQKGAVGDWDLGYCLSVHRSQGSQWKWVIYMIDSNGGMVQTRNAVYTGISRATDATFVVGQKKLIDAALRKDGIVGRKTFLVERIQRQRLMETVDHNLLMADV